MIPSRRRELCLWITIRLLVPALIKKRRLGKVQEIINHASVVNTEDRETLEHIIFEIILEQIMKNKRKRKFNTHHFAKSVLSGIPIKAGRNAWETFKEEKGGERECEDD